MLEEYSQINHFLVKVFNEVLRTEEASLKTKEFHNLSLREMHVIEAVCDAVQAAKNTASEIASSQRITAGTLTTTINTLEKKDTWNGGRISAISGLFGFTRRKKGKPPTRFTHPSITRWCRLLCRR